MVIIGVSGGVGAGKSRVLSYLQKEYQAQVERLDDIAKELLLPGGSNYWFYISLLGNDIVLPDQSLDKEKIAARIFADEKLLEQINEGINPAVRSALSARIREAKMRGVGCFVVESALLFAEHYDAICDETWYIYADESIRRERLKASRGYDDARIDRIMQHQMSDAAFLKVCDAVIDNSGDFEATKEEIDRRYYEILQHCQRQQR